MSISIATFLNISLPSDVAGGMAGYGRYSLRNVLLVLVTKMRTFRMFVNGINRCGRRGGGEGQDTKKEDLAAFTWISRDDPSSSSVFEVLLITSSEEGLWWERIWIGGSSDVAVQDDCRRARTCAYALNPLRS